MEKSDRLKRAQQIVTYLESDRQQNQDEDAKLISNYILPHRGYWPAENEQQLSILERARKIINPAATLSIERAGAGLTAAMTPEVSPWFGLKVEDKALMDAAGVRQHLQFRRDVINGILRKGGFYQAIHMCNQEILAFPGMLLFGDMGKTTLQRFECCTFGTWCIALDSEGKLSTVVRRFRWSAEQVEDKFGKDKMSENACRLLKDNPFEKIDIVHVVTPRKGRDTTKIDNINMMYSSIMYEDGIDAASGATTSASGKGQPGMVDGGTVKDVLSESGYMEMPYFYAPFSLSGVSDYGMSPGHLLIGHTRQLNETERQKVIALQKLVSPPTKKPSNYKNLLNVGPGGENPVSSNDPKGFGALYEVPVQSYQAALQEITDIMERIAAVAKADLFITAPDEMKPNDMTATEWLGKKREKLQLVAPFVSIYEPSVLTPLIERVHNVADRAGMFPPPPPALMEAGQIEINYTSAIFKALQQIGSESTRALISDIGGMVKLQAEAQQPITVIHKVNLAEAVDEISEGLGTPANIVRSDDEYAALVEADAQARAKQAAQQAEMEAAESASKLGVKVPEGAIQEAMDDSA